MTFDLMRFSQTAFAYELARVLLTGALPLGLLLWFVLMVRRHGVWGIGRRAADGLIRLGAWLHLVCNAGEYAVMAFGYRYRQQKEESR
jgi:acyl dehydratase